MSPEAVFLAFPVALVALVVGFVYWPAAVDERPGRPLLFLLRAGVWGGYLLVVLLLVTDAAAPSWLTETNSSPDKPGCLPVIGADLRGASPYLNDVVCATLTNARLGWALLCAVFATLCLATLTRMRIRDDVADRLAPARDTTPRDEG